MSVYEPLDSSMNGGNDGKRGTRRTLLAQNKNEIDDANSATDAESISLKSLSSRFSHAPELSEPLTSSTDPFYVFRDDLERKLERMDESLAEYLRLVHQTDTAVNGSDVKSAKKLLKRCIKSAESTLADVHTAVSLEQKKQGQEDDVEIGKRNTSSSQVIFERQQLVETSQDRIERAKREANSNSVQAKLLADERAMRRRRSQQGGGNDLGANTPAQIQNTDMILNSQARTSLLMQHQDETLEELDVAVSRVGDMAVAIGEEINQQNKMLDEMTTDLDNVEEELGLVMGKLAKFLKTKDSWQLGTILTLSATTVVLFFLVLYT